MWIISKRSSRTISKKNKQGGLENFEKCTNTKTELQIKCYSEELEIKLAQKVRYEEKGNIECWIKNEKYLLWAVKRKWLKEKMQSCWGEVKIKSQNFQCKVEWKAKTKLKLHLNYIRCLFSYFKIYFCYCLLAWAFLICFEDSQKRCYKYSFPKANKEWYYQTLLSNFG